MQTNNTHTQRLFGGILNLSLIAGAVLLFTLSFPNSLFISGCFPLAYIALIPVFVVIHRSSWPMIAIYGGLYGFFSYFFFNNWLGKFHPLALFIVPIIYCVYFLLFFPVLKLLDSHFPKQSYLLQTLAWVIFEYLRTQGFLGYSYGIIGYTQYAFIPLIKIADITGIWGIVSIVVFPSALLAWCLKKGIQGFFNHLKLQIKAIFIYAAVFIIVLGYGLFTHIPVQKDQTWRVALLQQNYDPWVNGYTAYARSLDISLRLSQEAIKEHPDIIIWSETSFVPAIEYHMKYRQNPVAYDLVKRLLDFLAEQSIPFVVGNDHGEMIQFGTPEEKRIDYNAAILFKQGKAVKIYKKTHLVPFTEHFPYTRQFPQIAQLLEDADTHFWEKGEEYTVFETDNVHFSTPICFEDTFGYLCAEFVRKGADVLVNLTNDLWSNSEAAEVQHMTMALFRAVENNRFMVRSTNGGITCIIDPNGKVVKKLEPFKEDYLIYDIPLYKKGKTLYCSWGDWFPIFIAIVLMVMVSVLLIIRIPKKNNNSK